MMSACHKNDASTGRSNVTETVSTGPTVLDPMAGEVLVEVRYGPSGTSAGVNNEETAAIDPAVPGEEERTRRDSSVSRSNRLAKE